MSEETSGERRDVLSSLDTVRTKARERFGLVRQKLTERVQIFGLGKGKLIDRIFGRVDSLTKTATDRGTGILPKLDQRLKSWQPGQRLQTLLPNLGENIRNISVKEPTPKEGITTKKSSIGYAAEEAASAELQSESTKKPVRKSKISLASL